MKAMNGVISFGFEPKLSFATWNDKFPQEKVCFENEDYLIHFDGVILNSTELKESLGCANNQQILIQLYENYGAQLVLRAKGLYALTLWDKRAQKILITNDLMSRRPMFYCRDDRCVCYGSSYHDVLDILAWEGYTPAINMGALEHMLVRGYVNGNDTYLNQVLYLNAFESLVVDLKAGTTQLVTHPMKVYDIPATQDGMIDKFDELFGAAVKLQFRKNAEYGYTQCVTLSGGMDSRSVLLSAYKQGFNKDIVCCNYAQSGSLDYSISQQIASDLCLDYVFYPMDAAVFVERLHDDLALNECMQAGIGATGARSIATLLNTSNCGLIGLGICGGELMGDLIYKNWGEQSSCRVIRVARRILRGLWQELTHAQRKAEDYVSDLQEYLCHLRASQNSAHMFLDKCECISPFMDEDVVMYVRQLNPGLICDRRFYTDWMLKHLPNPYITTSTCSPVGSSRLRIAFSTLKYRVFARHNGVGRFDMNPITHWFKVQPRHAEYCTKEYEEGCRWLTGIEGSEVILQKLQSAWNNPWSKRLHVLTALQALKDIHSRFGKIC